MFFLTLLGQGLLQLTVIQVMAYFGVTYPASLYLLIVRSSLWEHVSNIQFFTKPGTANMLPMCCYCPSFYSWQILLINHDNFPAELGLGSKLFSTQPSRQALPIDQRCHSRGKHLCWNGYPYPIFLNISFSCVSSYIIL